MKISYNWLKNIAVIFISCLLPLSSANAICTTDFATIIGPYPMIIAIVFLFLIRSIYRYIKKKSSSKSILKNIIVLIIVVILSIIFMNNDVRIDNYLISEKCKIFDGKLEEICGTVSCELPSKDFGKPCKDNSECEKYCEIYNDKEIFDKWLQYSDKEKISIDEWIKKEHINVDSRCSKFNGSMECNNIFYKSIFIENGSIKKRSECKITNY